MFVEKWQNYLASVLFQGIDDVNRGEISGLASSTAVFTNMMENPLPILQQKMGWQAIPSCA